jgi:hypothetical protein
VQEKLQDLGFKDKNMATINPLMRPIDYTVDVQSPFESALGGFKLGAGIAEVQAAQQARERAQTAQTELANLFKILAKRSSRKCKEIF